MSLSRNSFEYRVDLGLLAALSCTVTIWILAKGEILQPILFLILGSMVLFQRALLRRIENDQCRMSRHINKIHDGLLDHKEAIERLSIEGFDDPELPRDGEGRVYHVN